MIGNFDPPEQEQVVLIDLNPTRLPPGAVGIALEDSHDRYMWDPETCDVIDTTQVKIDR